MHFAADVHPRTLQKGEGVGISSLGVIVQIREILQADQAPGSGTKVKEADGSSEANGSNRAGPGQSAIKDGLSNGAISKASGNSTAVGQQKNNNVTILGKSTCDTSIYLQDGWISFARIH